MRDKHNANNSGSRRLRRTGAIFAMGLFSAIVLAAFSGFWPGSRAKAASAEPIAAMPSENGATRAADGTNAACKNRNESNRTIRRAFRARSVITGKIVRQIQPSIWRAELYDTARKLRLWCAKYSRAAGDTSDIRKYSAQTLLRHSGYRGPPQS